MKKIITILFLIHSLGLNAETIKMKNGSKLSGEIELMTESDVLLKTEEIGKVLVKRSEIDSISDEVVKRKIGPNLNTEPDSFESVAPNIEVINATTPSYKNQSKWFFGLNMGFIQIPGFGEESTYEFTPIGHRFRNGLELSVSIELDTKFQDPKIDPNIFSSELLGYGDRSVKKFSIGASYPFLQWRMLGSGNEIKAKIKVGVVDILSQQGFSRETESGPNYSTYKATAGFEEIQGLTTEVGLHYSLRLMSFLDFNIGGGMGLVAYKFKNSRYELSWQDGGEKKKTYIGTTDKAITSHFYTGFRILI